MNVILFQPQFEALILAGVKVHTIRAHRKDGRPRAVAGEELSLRVWTARPYNSPQREFARSKVEMIFPVIIDHNRVYRSDWSSWQMGLMDRNFVAKQDGFENWLAMREWFQRVHGLPFEGELIRWRR